MSNFLAAESSTNADRPETLNEGRIDRIRRAGALLEAAPLWTLKPRHRRTALQELRQQMDGLTDTELVVVDDRTVPTLADVPEIDEPVSAASTAIVLHRPDTSGAAPDRRNEVDVIAARGWRSEGTVTVRFEPEYHRMVDLPNPPAPARARQQKA
ncbi:hypothetical protein [Streptomyces sp.]|uniref:hypothetical protein n=1 Tax=Streptomyces sp. TaxID=1931 RepID=UPI002D76B2B3|nr:hypothetical protein [Streptomyces sp.]HET6357770.1 hypothetical protein [Streptomyces sp.]